MEYEKKPVIISVVLLSYNSLDLTPNKETNNRFCCIKIILLCTESMNILQIQMKNF